MRLTTLSAFWTTRLVYRFLIELYVDCAFDNMGDSLGSFSGHIYSKNQHPYQIPIQTRPVMLDNHLECTVHVQHESKNISRSSYRRSQNSTPCKTQSNAKTLEVSICDAHQTVSCRAGQVALSVAFEAGDLGAMAIVFLLDVVSISRPCWSLGNLPCRNARSYMAQSRTYSGKILVPSERKYTEKQHLQAHHHRHCSPDSRFPSAIPRNPQMQNYQ